jgi:hypothetical protein
MQELSGLITTKVGSPRGVTACKLLQSLSKRIPGIHFSYELFDRSKGWEWGGDYRLILLRISYNQSLFEVFG